ncbi:putative ABC transporter ATP-binding protein NosF [wastewater metagenome]|uniref:Putative ABC transporter ATP-binding protein NosF n=2 Tax=unclassified sequences TaxID=12908 RepID=A0A5B8RAF2_9ZZZZ|nr:MULTISPECIES: ABC transporter ATP-binding protein [Arhodomonas]QEA04504.1 putative ABC transporter ATP-binding protein NosF [uncultured organism]
MSDAVIELRGVEKHYGRFHALRGIDLAARDGELLALLGHNGAGKTTLLKILLGLTGASRGHVRVLGERPGTPAAVASRARIGFLPENVVFAGGMTGREVARTLARLKGRPVAESEALLERVGLTDAAARPVRTYSKGMRQRLGLAQALIGRPRLLLLDEPTTGLDPVLRRTFYAILAELRGEGTTILVSSHVLAEMELHTDRVAIMRGGELTACDTLPGLCSAAGLPVRVRVQPGDGAAAQCLFEGTWPARRQANGGVELQIAADEKMPVLRWLGGLPDGAVTDVGIHTPSLDEVYAHFASAEGEGA